MRKAGITFINGEAIAIDDVVDCNLLRSDHNWFRINNKHGTEIFVSSHNCLCITISPDEDEEEES